MAWIAAWAEFSSPKFTNPKPRLLPVSRSKMTLASTTFPWGSNAARRLASSVEWERPPTNSLVPMAPSLWCALCVAPIGTGLNDGEYSSASAIRSRQTVEKSEGVWRPRRQERARRRTEKPD